MAESRVEADGHGCGSADRPGWFCRGLASLAIFAWLLTLVDVGAAGRAYAAYGGIYISASLTWLWVVEGIAPDRWDLVGGGVCLLGTVIILLGPRGAV